MSIGRTNPNRMELMKLKDKLKMTSRGHKLLKDKQDELIHQFVLLVYETRDLRLEVDDLFPEMVNEFSNVKKKRSLSNIYELLMVPTGSVNLDYDTKSIMAVDIPKITIKESKEVNDKTYSDLTSPQEIDNIQENMKSLLPKIIKLAELEQQIRLMADEIEKLRRRVNVIENVMIPELNTEIKRIEMKLEEDERSNTVRIMKSKEIVIENMLKERAKRNK